MRRYPQWTRRVSLIANSKTYACWPELSRRTPFCRRNEIISSGTLRFLPSNSGAMAVENSLDCHLQAKQTTMARFIQLRNLRMGLQPKPRLAPALRTRSPPKIICGQKSLPGRNLSRSACCGQAQDLASSLILFFARDIIAGLLTDRGPAPVHWSRDVDGAYDRSSFSESPGPGQLALSHSP